MKTHHLALSLLVSGCATTLDPNFSVQMQAYSDTVRAQQQVEMARARAEEARYNALAAIAQTSDGTSRQMAILALALGKGGEAGARNIAVTLPTIPESQEDRALKWAAIFAGPVTNVATGYFGYRLGATQSNNQRDTSIASYNALGTIGLAGFGANTSIATAGFGANTSIAAGGLTAAQNIAVTGLVRPPTITLNGTGVISGRDGSYVGPNSGANSGNTGRIASPDDDHRAVNCTPTPTVPC
jgi:hypothetical protein